MVLYTTYDITFSSIIADRILMRRNFEILRDRPNSKYFKNIIIKDVEWNKNFELPSNIPKSFLQKYPYDCEIYFTTLGCNALKCYKHNYSKPCENPFVINKGEVYGCSDACSGIYREFNDFLRENFDIDNINSNDKTEFPFETISIKDETNNCDYCGIQLTNYKKYAILPSSRWNDGEEDDDDDDVIPFIEKYKKEPLKLSQIAGLVDSPPLSWSVSDQDAHFNKEYCNRFLKQYDEENDVCTKRPHRVALGYIFGDNFLNLFPDLDYTGKVPHSYLTDMILAKGLNVNTGYIKDYITQSELERRVFSNNADIRVTDGGVNVTSYKKSSSNTTSTKVSERTIEVNNILLEILKSLSMDEGLEMGLTQTPAIAAKLLHYYSPKILKYALSSTKYATIPFTTRLSAAIVRTIILDISVKTTIKALALTSTVASGILAVGIITLVPDMLLGIYNIGGYNNEISRDHLNEMRKQHINNLLNAMLTEYKDMIDYIYIDQNNYVSPLITPEFIYNLCLIQFLISNPEKRAVIGFNGINQKKHIDLVNEYLTQLTVNSAGQYIDYKYDNQMSDIQEKKVITLDNQIMDKENNDISYLKENKDLLLLITGLALLLFSLLFLYNGMNVPFNICILYSLLTFASWFIVINPLIYKEWKNRGGGILYNF